MFWKTYVKFFYKFCNLTVLEGGYIIVKKKLYTLQPKKQRWRKIGIATALIVFIGAGLFFGTIKIVDATQTDTTHYPERTV